MITKEAEPPLMEDLSPNIKKIFTVFDKNVDKLKQIFEKNPEINDVITLFEDKNSPIYESFSKAVKILELAAEERKFTLTPLIANYNNLSYKTHHFPNIFNKFNNINHIFVKPIYAVEDFYYTYKLYVPIPIDILEEDDRRKMLKDHWSMITEAIPEKMRHNLIMEFCPLYTINRVYGWDSAWLAYVVTVIDRGDFWSLPLINSPYNGVQPYVCLPKGEFAILERDATESSRRKETTTLNQIENRVKQDQSISFVKSKSIEVNPQWLAATIDYSKKAAKPDFKEVSQIFGGKLGTASIDKELPNNAEDLLKFMKKEVFGQHQYEFTSEDIGNCRIHRKLGSFNYV